MTTSRDDSSASATPTELTERLQIPPAALAPLPAGMSVDNLLLASVRNDTLVLLLAREPLKVKARDTVQLLDDGGPMGGDIPVDPYLGDTDIPLPVSPADRTDERIYRINYRVTYGSGDPGNPVTGPDDQQFIVDYTAPGGETIAHLLFGPLVDTGGVTPDRLSTDSDGNQYLPATVVSYFDMQDGDHIQARIDDASVAVVADVAYGEAGNDKELRFPRALLEDLGTSPAGDGKFAFAFDVVDRAGNRSRLSEEVRLRVALKGIENLLPPRVSGAVDGLLTIGDARDVFGAVTGVIVHIPCHQDIVAGDTIVWRWNGHESDPIPVDASHVGKDPLMIVTAPYDTVYDDWFAVARDTDRDVVAEVSYRVEREGELKGEPAPPTEADVNLFGAGGKDPHPETPEHENLFRPSVQGGGPVNVIPGDDLENDAIATIKGMTNTEPPVSAFRIGDRIQLYWDGDAVDEEAVVETIGMDVKRTIPSAVLQAHSPGTWNVHYTATRALANVPFLNVALSPTQTVEVMDAKDIPGGGDLLAAAKWVEGSDSPPTIDINEANSGGGTPVRIYQYVNMAVGDEISAKFLGYDGIERPPESDPVPESEHDVVHLVVPDDLVPKRDDTVTPPVDAVYIDILIPTEKILPIDFGRAHFDYTVKNKAGTGIAKQAWVYVAVR